MNEKSIDQDNLGKILEQQKNIYLLVRLYSLQLGIKTKSYVSIRYFYHEISKIKYRLLLNYFERTGLSRELELSDQDLADALWLASHMGTMETDNSQPKTEELSVSEIVQSGSETTEKQEPTTEKYFEDTQEQKDVINLVEDFISPEINTLPETRGLPFQVPAAPAIQDKLEICRALRPLMRKVPSLTKLILDEEATVTRIAERDIWLPVTKPKPERWLNLELVVEETPASFIWQETINELQQLLETHGAFRNVRVWNLSSLDVKLTRRKRDGTINSRQHSYRELIHSNNRGLILFVSDCVSLLWQQGKIHKCLKQWSKHQTIAVIQLFPERLWLSSQLGLGYKVKFKSFAPIVFNSQLVCDSPDEDLVESSTLSLPIITLEAEYLKSWAKVLAGYGKFQTTGIVFDLEFVRQQVPEVATIETQELSAEAIVDRFLTTASDTAQQLAGYMAAVPVCLPVVNLIQRSLLLNKSTSVNVAEVFLSGMIQRNDQAEVDSLIKYDFVPGARKLLNLAMRVDQTEKVLDVISAYIAEKLGLSIKSFTALLLNFDQFDEQQKQGLLPFAKVAIKVLENLGGEYAEFAKTIKSEKIKDKNPFEIIGAKPKTFSFEVATFTESSTKTELELNFVIATIEIQETRDFEFSVATLERKQGILGIGGSWQINKEQQQGTAIIEVIEPDVDLEMISIPGGNFMMGAPKDELESRDRERPLHKVNISTFLIGRYPITQAQWRVVAGWEQVERELKSNDPSGFKEDYEGIDRWQRPVEQVSWDDAVEFCLRLSRKTGKKYRLPTEAEWEYACRAGTTTPFHFGETISTELANYNGNRTYGEGVKGEYRGQTTPVGYFKVANNFGLSDMHGNAWEWCEDDWQENYENAPKDGSAWRSQDNNLKVIRGGSWFINPDFCRSAYRDSYTRVDRPYNIGFRVVCVAPRTT